MTDATLEQEIIERIRQLDPVRQQQVLDFVRALGEPAGTSKEWFQAVDALHEKLRAKYGDTFDVVADLDEVREERLNDLMGGE